MAADYLVCSVPQMTILATLLLSAGLAVQDPGPATQSPNDKPGQGDRPQQTRPMPIPREFLFQRDEDTEIVIDGSVQEWPVMPAFGLDDPRQLSGTALGAWRGPTDLAARVFMLWDEKYLYLAANVLDDWHVALRKGAPRLSEIPPADALTLTIDPLRDTHAIGTPIGRDDDCVIWLAEVEGQGKQIVLWGKHRSVARFAEDGQAVVRRDVENRQTYYEMRLAWSDILPAGMKPEVSQVFDMQIEIDDLDEPTDPMPQTRLGWNFGMGPAIDPDAFGSVKLSDGTPSLLLDVSFGQPKIDPPASPPEKPAFQREFWTALANDLASGVPVIHPDPDAPTDTDRQRALALLDAELAQFSRVDLQLMQHRLHRRMRREGIGHMLRGLPYFWATLTRRVAEELESSPPESGFRLVRLPMRGYVVRTPNMVFAIDAAGPSIDQLLGNRIEMLLLTRPIDVTRRHDQLVLRAVRSDAASRVFTHLPFHVPGATVEEMPLVRPGENRSVGALVVEVLDPPREDGKVSPALSYRLRFRDGSTMVIATPSFDEVWVTGDEPPDVLLLSAEHPRARAVAQRVSAGLVVWDDSLQCETARDIPRATLGYVNGLIEGCSPKRSVLLAPGDVIELPIR